MSGNFTTIDELRKDKARLDWLSENLSYVMLARKDRFAMSQLENKGDGWNGDRLRNAIDSAMKTP